MKKNVASQTIAAQMNSRVDGSPLTSSVSVYVTVDGGTQNAGTGTLSHKGNGAWNYVPDQSETNGDHIAFTFVHATGIDVTVQVYTTFPQTGDGYGILNNGTYGNSALKTLIDTNGTDINSVLTNLTLMAGAGFDTDNDSLKAIADAIAAGIAIGIGGIQATSFAANSIGAAALATDAAQEIATALLDLTNGVETSTTVRQALRLILSALAGKLSGAATATIKIRDINDTKDRITATVDADGNRTAVVRDVS